MSEPKRLGIVGYTSEWANMMLYEAIFRYGLSDKFVISTIAGREESSKDAAVRLLRKIGERGSSLAEKLQSGGEAWRVGKNLAFVRNASSLVEMLESGKIKYYRINSDGTLPLQFYSSVEAVGIYTANPYHLAPLKDAVQHGKHALVEKPTVPVICINGNPTRKDLDELIKLENNKPADLIIQDAEHYSAKKASKTLFNNIWDMISKYGEITSIKGEILEKDDPNNPRTKALLNKKNRTGLLTDTGVHLFSILTNLGYEIKNIASAEYAIHPEYDAETYAHIKFKIYHRAFNTPIPCEFTVAKFIHLMKEDMKQESESKKIEIKFKKNCTLTIDFSKGYVFSSDGKYKYYTNKSSFEYANILTDFYNAIERGRDPRTSIGNSIRNLEAIYFTLSKFSLNNNLKDIYAEK